jgi:hypothetical protein
VLGVGGGGDGLIENLYWARYHLTREPKTLGAGGRGRDSA